MPPAAAARRPPVQCLALVLLALMLPGWLAASVVRDIRLGRHEGFVRCVIESDTPIEFRLRDASRDDNLVSFQFISVTSVPTVLPGSADLGLVRGSRASYIPASNVLFLHLDTTGEVRIETSRLENPHRLVIDLHAGGGAVASPPSVPAPVVGASPPVGASAAQPAAPPSNRSQKRIIVIDPGHGGRHRGGQGVVRGRKVEEAELTLPIAFELEKLMQADPQLEPRLTRRTDVYVGLRERTRLAEQFGGDIFVSIHYNAVPASRSKTSARGMEIYTWSQHDSRDAAERYLQDLENEEGQYSDIARADRNARMVLSKMMLDALEEQSLRSKDFGRHLETAFLRDAYFKKDYRGLKSARFRVLENYNMPSVLIEVAFISHPDEAARAVTPAFQRTVARHIYEGIVSYLEATDPAFRAARAQGVARR